MNSVVDASEAVPGGKTGGLAEVGGERCKQLDRSKGNKVRWCRQK